MRLRKPGMQMLTGTDEATGSYFATRVGLTLPETPTADRAKQAIFLVDTSLSAGPQFPLWTKLLRATLENNRDSIREFAVLFFNVETFWWQEKFVANTPENVEALHELCRRPGPGRGHRPGPGTQGSGLARVEVGWALARLPICSCSATARPPGARIAGRCWRGHLITEQGKAPAVGRTHPRPLSTSTETGSRATALTPGPTLFAYRTGLAGGDPRLLAYLAEQTGGAVFSLVGEAEIAAASVAHRNRPWRLTGIEMAGGHDLLVAGRPQYVFPGQQLLVVGRLEAEVDAEQ